MMMFMAAVFANLYSWAATQDMQTSLHVLVVLAFLAASMAAANSFKWIKQDAILELFLTIM